ncbi:MAG: molybdopterin converting factor subunit 1 [Deltaproteobacteria bacterium]|nr:molybdopterin converting factor subunit 1 [Deltaproteobacteria bacterium]MBI3016958.1 molybdopterin converting factor subunit 1 [Deltaproteobacteria bacterium]
MKIKVLYFTHLKSITQKDHENLDLSHPMTLLKLHHILEQKYPNFLELKHLAIAVNETYAKPHAQLKEGDTVCFIPPVAGG